MQDRTILRDLTTKYMDLCSDPVQDERRDLWRKLHSLVVTTSNALQPGAQLENYLAMRQAIRDYGRYPIAL